MNFTAGKSVGIRIVRARGLALGRAFTPLIMCAVLGGTLAGCALGRDVVDVAPPMVTAPSGAMTGAPAKIVVVSDNRVFEAAPREPSTPSLQDAKDISNPAITSRAFARKRGSYGGAFGDIVLPEGHTVADLVKVATQKALQEKGYRVVDASSPDFGNAVPVSVDIKELWAWFTPGLFTVTVECRATVNLGGGALAAAPPVTVTGYAKTSGMAATDSDYAQVLKQALDDLTTKMEAQIKSP